MDNFQLLQIKTKDMQFSYKKIMKEFPIRISYKRSVRTAVHTLLLSRASFIFLVIAREAVLRLQPLRNPH